MVGLIEQRGVVWCTDAPSGSYHVRLDWNLLTRREGRSARRHIERGPLPAHRQGALFSIPIPSRAQRRSLRTLSPTAAVALGVGSPAGAEAGRWCEAEGKQGGVGGLVERRLRSG